MFEVAISMQQVNLRLIIAWRDLLVYALDKCIIIYSYCQKSLMSVCYVDWKANYTLPDAAKNPTSTVLFLVAVTTSKSSNISFLSKNWITTSDLHQTLSTHLFPMTL